MTSLERGISMKDALTPNRLGRVMAQGAVEKGDMLQASALYATGYASSVLTWALPVALAAGVAILPNYDEWFGKRLTFADLERGYEICDVRSNSQGDINSYLELAGIPNNSKNRELLKAEVLNANNADFMAELKQKPMTFGFCPKSIKTKK